jgi:predicted  nucleic acid-binding Zn-ribbon protein
MIQGMATNPQFLESAFKDLMNELREIKDTVKKIDRKVDALEYKLSQIKTNS